jgi:hypothetical protein
MTFRHFPIQIGPRCANAASVAQRKHGRAEGDIPIVYIGAVAARMFLFDIDIFEHFSSCLPLNPPVPLVLCLR